VTYLRASGGAWALPSRTDSEGEFGVRMMRGFGSISVVAVLGLLVTMAPAPVAATGDDVKGISVGDNYFACAVKLGGDVWCWGDNEYLQLGDRTEVEQRDRPVRVKRANGTLLQNITQIDSGGYHTCGRRGDGTAWCWGEGGLKLGNGSTGSVLGAVQVTGLTDVKQVAAGLSHSCALKTGGGVFCWGYGPALGADVEVESATPVRVKTATGNLSGVKAISASGNDTCALRTDGKVFCWGRGGAKLQGALDVMVAKGMKTGTGSGTATSIEVGQDHVCMIRADGVARCWGANGNAEIGDGTTENRLTPTEVRRGAGALTTTSVISAGHFHSCAAAGSAKHVFCWGQNGSGQGGNGTEDDPSLTAIAMKRGNGGSIAAIAIAAGDSVTCVLRPDRAVFCTGYGSDGTIGDGQATSVTVATRVAFPD
jgi:alpha-tubulin suppressor-like RCC1 family protein